MPIPHFYEPSISRATHFILNESTGRHCIQVLRMKQDEKLKLTDGKGNWCIASIQKADKNNCEVTALKCGQELHDTRNVSVAISLLKNISRFEWFLEKAVEIGVSEIIPLICSRTEKQQFRYERMKHILISAMLQSRQVWLPELRQAGAFSEVICNAAYTQKLIAHCDENKLLKEFILEDNIQILIGPEGDFTTHEIELALKHNYHPVSLGKTILRAETAGVVASALLINT